MTHSTVLIPLVLLLGATVPCLAEEGSKQNFTCTAKAFNDCLMEAPCSAWKRLGPKDYKLGPSTFHSLGHSLVTACARLKNARANRHSIECRRPQRA